MAEAKTDDMAAKWTALQAPFDAESISLLPRATGDKEKRTKKQCAECGGYHEFPCIHLSYVGHADITMRLNEVDPMWTWEPMAYDDRGLPALDSNGGLWAWLTILGSRKPAYGDPGLNFQNKTKAGTPDGMKEAIGDMLRNGAMRFGVGTALWSKSDKAKQTLAPEDEPTSSPAHGSSGTERAKLASDNQIKAIFGLARDLGWTDEKLFASISKSLPGKDHPGDLTGGRDGEASRMIEFLKAQLASKQTQDVAADLGASVSEQGPCYADEEIPF